MTLITVFEQDRECPWAECSLDSLPSMELIELLRKGPWEWACGSLSMLLCLQNSFSYHEHLWTQKVPISAHFSTSLRKAITEEKQVAMSVSAATCLMSSWCFLRKRRSTFFAWSSLGYLSGHFTPKDRNLMYHVLKYNWQIFPMP